MASKWKLPWKKAADASPRQARHAYARPRRRHFEAAKSDRLMAGFMAAGNSSNANLRAALPVLRARSRALCDNNGYAKKILRTTVTNVVGPRGFTLQFKVKKKNGKTDKTSNQVLENHWKKWGKLGSASICGKLSWLDCQKLFMKSVARDGEVLVRFITGPAAGNPYGFALQFLEADHLDINKRGKVGANEIEMGVETNGFGRPVGYHILKEHPGDFKAQGQDWIRLDASEVIHAFVVERPGQMRGIPMLTASIKDLQMLGGFIDAELVSKRASASKMGFIYDMDGDEFDNDNRDKDPDQKGEVIKDFEAGVIEQLPAGKKFHGYDPQHDGKGLMDFVRVIMRGVGSGTNTTYHSIANDLTDVNFSSIRSGELAARDEWKGDQEWMMAAFCERVMEAWLGWALTMGSVPLQLADEQKYKDGAAFQGRGWQWVDPLKDAQANQLRHKLRSKSLTQIAAEEGRTLEEVAEEIAAELELLKDYGIELVEENSGGPTDGNTEDDDETNKPGSDPKKPG